MEAGGSEIVLGECFSFGCRERSETVMEAILDNAGISMLSTEVGGELMILLVPACAEREEAVDDVDGLPGCGKAGSIKADLRPGETGYLRGPVVEDTGGGTLDRK